MTTVASIFGHDKKGTRLVLFRKWNVLEGFIGNVGCGKTESATLRLLELIETPAYVIAFDPDGNIPDELYDGTPTGVIRHETIAECKDALFTDADSIHSIQDESFESVLDFVQELAAASLAQNGSKEDGTPVMGVPVVFYVDEGVLVDDADAHRIGDELKKFIARRRHKHVGLIYTVQDPTFIHHTILTLATRNHFFFIRGKEKFRFLESRVGLTSNEIQRIKRVKQFEFVTVYTNPFDDPNFDPDDTDEND